MYIVCLPFSEFAHDGSAKDTSKNILNLTLQQVPAKGEFDIKSVNDSVYFFS